jgi:hypothetical protein
MDIVVHEPLHSYMGSQAKHMVIKMPMAPFKKKAHGMAKRHQILEI